jgi:aminoacrylate peracid reductase
MAHQPVIPEKALPSLAPYSPGVKAGNTVYTSGILSLDKNGNVVGIGDAAEQTRQVLILIKSIVEAAGGQMSDIVFNAIFLKLKPGLATRGARRRSRHWPSPRRA